MLTHFVHIILNKLTINIYISVQFEKSSFYWFGLSAN